MNGWRVAGIQHDIVWEDPAANMARLAPMIADAAHRGARLVALTEMWSTGFSMATGRTAEAPGGASTAFLVEQARAHGVWVCASVPERRAGDDRPVNCFVLAAPDGSVRRYAKLHPFTYGREHEHYAAGDELVTWDVEGVRVSPFVCYDLRFADEFWQLAPATDLYVVVANWPAGRRAHWTTLLAARAIENQAYVLGVNRVGSGGGLDYAGDSRLVDPFGELVAEASSYEESLLVGDVDLDRLRAVRSRYPFLRDRRTFAG